MEILYRSYFGDARSHVIYCCQDTAERCSEIKLSTDTISTDATSINTYAAKYTFIPRSRVLSDLSAVKLHHGHGVGMEHSYGFPV